MARPLKCWTFNQSRKFSHSLIWHLIQVTWLIIFANLFYGIISGDPSRADSHHRKFPPLLRVQRQPRWAETDVTVVSHPCHTHPRCAGVPHLMADVCTPCGSYYLFHTFHHCGSWTVAFTRSCVDFPTTRSFPDMMEIQVLSLFCW